MNESINPKDKFEEIYNTHYLKVYNWVQKFIPSRPEAEDIAADVFTKLWQKRHGPINNISAFLYVLAKNAAIDYIRKHKLQKQHEKELHYLNTQDTNSDFPEDLKTEVISIILKEIEQLPISFRIVFKLAFFEGLKNEEIALKLGISNQSVRNAKYRATQLLRIKFPQSMKL